MFVDIKSSLEVLTERLHMPDIALLRPIGLYDDTRSFIFRKDSNKQFYRERYVWGLDTGIIKNAAIPHPTSLSRIS